MTTNEKSAQAAVSESKTLDELLIQFADNEFTCGEAEADSEEFREAARQGEVIVRKIKDLFGTIRAERDAAQAECARLRGALEEINNCIVYSDTYGTWVLVGRERTQPALEKVRAALRETSSGTGEKCETCGDKGYVYDGEAVTGRGPDDVFPEKVACPDCTRETEK